MKDLRVSLSYVLSTARLGGSVGFGLIPFVDSLEVKKEDRFCDETRALRA